MSAIEQEPGRELCAASAGIEARCNQCGGIGQLSNYLCSPLASEEVALELGLSRDINGQGIAGRGRVYPCLAAPPDGLELGLLAGAARPPGDAAPGN
eukprot:5317167-Pyramimonas_sp.AAC.1